jgi:hypothetical protein
MCIGHDLPALAEDPLADVADEWLDPQAVTMEPAKISESPVTASVLARVLGGFCTASLQLLSPTTA